MLHNSQSPWNHQVLSYQFLDLGIQTQNANIGPETAPVFTWSLNSRRSRSSSARLSASSPSRRSARTSWNGTKTEIFPLEAIKKAGQLGLLGAIFPEELGGAGLGYIEYAIIIEELARVDPSVGLIVAAHNSLCTNHIYLAGNDEQRTQIHSASLPRANGSAAGR